MKVIRISLPNKEVFELKAEVVALERTKYYADVDGFTRGSREWDEEFENSMEDYELTDWLSNNMNWEDIESHLTKVEMQIDYLYKQKWTS